MQNFFATDPKNIVNFEIGNKSATCGPAATKTSKVNDTLIFSRVILTFYFSGAIQLQVVLTFLISK